MSDSRNSSDPPSTSRRTVLIGAFGALSVAVLSSAAGPAASAIAATVPSFTVANQRFSRPISPANLSTGGGWNDLSGKRENRHCGQDYYGGSVIFAAASGWIRGVSENVDTYGYTVTMEHPNGMWSYYAHMKAKSTKIAGEWISRGDPIGRVGATGGDYAEHCHLAIATTRSRLIDRDPSTGYALSVDPEAYIISTANYDDPETTDEDPMPKVFTQNRVADQSLSTDWRSMDYDTGSTDYLIANGAARISATVTLAIEGLTTGQRAYGRFLATISSDTAGTSGRAFGAVTFDGNSAPTQYFEVSVNAGLESSEKLRFQVKTATTPAKVTEFRVHALYWD